MDTNQTHLDKLSAPARGQWSSHTTKSTERGAQNGNTISRKRTQRPRRWREISGDGIPSPDKTGALAFCGAVFAPSEREKAEARNCGDHHFNHWVRRHIAAALRNCSPKWSATAALIHRVAERLPSNTVNESWSDPASTPNAHSSCLPIRFFDAFLILRALTISNPLPGGLIGARCWAGAENSYPQVVPVNIGTQIVGLDGPV